MPEKVIAATGSRDFYARTDAEQALAKLGEYVQSNADAHWLVGGAVGWDFAVMQKVANAGLPFTLCLPNSGYVDYYWKVGRVTEQQRFDFDSLASQAHKVVYVADSLYSMSRDVRQPNRKIHSNNVRNQYMVDWATHLVSYWTGTSGGTKHCLEYAASKELPMFHCGMQYQ